MNLYEKLLQQGFEEGLIIKEKPLFSDIKGFCKGNKIALNTNKLDTSIEKRCILAEEIWHSKLTVGDITDTTNISNLKQERLARVQAIKDLAPLDKIVQGLIDNCNNIYELADYLEVTEEFLHEAFEYYIQRYGNKYHCAEYTISFNPIFIVGSAITPQGDEFL